MKNISTPLKTTNLVTQQSISKPAPSRRALDFVRQFARVYQPSRIGIIDALPGIVLN